jgi:hypothetical protein
MLGQKERSQLELFISGSLRQLIPDDHVLVRVDRVLDLSWLRDEVADCYWLDDGRPSGPNLTFRFAWGILWRTRVCESEECASEPTFN